MNYADKRVLIIEDQRPFLLLLRGLMNSMGATDVVTKPSAEQAIALSKVQKFDIIVADLHLGADKKNGFELIEELRIRKLIKPSTIFIIISADSARPMVLGSLERRPDDYLIKPFSQAQLKSRISRSWQKRQYLQPVYAAIFNNKLDEAIASCEQFIAEECPYKGSCEQILTELYWQTGQSDKALKMLSHYETSKPVLWALIALGRTYLNLNNAERACALAEHVLKLNRFSAEAYDILAEAQSNLNEGESAVESIKQAIKISPFSLPRHYTACNIARENDDFELASSSSLSIWNLSKHTVHQDVSQWCGYIRSILDVAEHAEDKRKKNRFQQEALLVMQRSRFDEALHRIDENFDLSIFEQVVHARINALDGKLIDAKRNLAHSQVAIEQKYDDYPLFYAPDSLKVMYDLGEFDEAQALTQLLERNKSMLDPNSLYVLQSESHKAAEKSANYQQHNRQGIRLYQQGQFEQAKDAFMVAQQFAPMNTGIALNLMQCMLKILNKNEKPEPTLVRECRRMYKLIEDVPLKPQHQEKFDGLKTELFEYIGIN